MPNVSHSDIELYYEIAGDGPPLLMLPGMGMDSSHWGGFPGMISASLQVICPDLRGTGRSPRGERPLTLQQLSQDLIAVLDHAGCQDVSVAGISFGGVLAQYFAIHYPTRVRKLVLIATHGVESRRFAAVRDSMRTLMSRLTPDEFASALMPYLFSVDFFQRSNITAEAIQSRWTLSEAQIQTALEQLEASKNQDWSDRIGEIAIPSLLIAGDEDAITPLHDMELLSATLQDSRMIVMPGVGHSPLAEHPRDCARHITEFLL